MFQQTFDIPDIPVIALLVVLEGVLSIDNALVLGLLAKRLPKHQQKLALTYGLVGAFVFRFIAIGTATFLLKWTLFKLLGGAYLLWVAIKHFALENRHHDAPIRIGPDGHPIIDDDAPSPAVTLAKFWPTVFVIEMTDIAFAVDSILAAIALVGPAPVGHVGTHPKLWVVILGGFVGVILMRFAAIIFIRMLDRFPRFETAAYLLVCVIGLKLVIDWAGNKFLATPENPHPVDFHDLSSPAFWVFWVLMIVCFAVGFIPRRKPEPAVAH